MGGDREPDKNADREPIHEARQKHFARWPASRVPDRLREIGRKGIAETREELSHHHAYDPDPQHEEDE